MLTLVVIIALTAYATVEGLRSLRWVAGRVMRGVKPWSCNFCMSVWTSFVLLVGYDLTHWRQPTWDDGTIWGGTSGLCLLILTWAETLAPHVGEPVELSSLLIPRMPPASDDENLMAGQRDLGLAGARVAPGHRPF